MRLAVAGTGYQGAVEAYVTGNHLAADCCRSLAAELSGYGAMAGDDTTAEDFAASYDEAAAASLAALGELTFGLAALGHLAATSLHNHAWADTVTGPPTLADRSVGVRPAPPPSSRGSGSSTLPHWADVVLDLLQGVFWPSADTGRLRAAAGTWRGAATSVGLLGAHCSTAIAALADELSPEVPLAVAATAALRDRVEALADEFVTLGLACETYADQVDAKRAELLDLLEQLAAELAIGTIVTGAIVFATGGTAAPAAGAVASAQVATASTRLRGVLDSLLFLNRGTATTLRPVAAAARDSRAYLSRVAAARRMEMTERGSVNLGEFFGRRPFKRGFLGAHEDAGGHTLLKHVGKTDDQLAQRFVLEPNRRLSSTFTDRETAERAVQQVANDQRSTIDQWMAGDRYKKILHGDARDVIGRIMARDTGEITASTKVRLVLVRDPALPTGWRIQTAFPE